MNNEINSAYLRAAMGRLNVSNAAIETIIASKVFDDSVKIMTALEDNGFDKLNSIPDGYAARLIVNVSEQNTAEMANRSIYFKLHDEDFNKYDYKEAVRNLFEGIGQLAANYNISSINSMGAYTENMVRECCDYTEDYELRVDAAKEMREREKPYESFSSDEEYDNILLDFALRKLAENVKTDEVLNQAIIYGEPELFVKTCFAECFSNKEFGRQTSKFGLLEISNDHFNLLEGESIENLYDGVFNKADADVKEIYDLFSSENGDRSVEYSVV